MKILLGSCMLDDNGTLLWSTGLGHPDKIYLTDIDPDVRGIGSVPCRGTLARERTWRLCCGCQNRTTGMEYRS